MIEALFRSKEYLADINVSPPSAHWTFASFVPQKALLQSPLIKFFLSHCGSGGLAESLYFGVPIICMPQMVDQFANADMAHIMGMPKPLPLTLQKAPLDALFTEFFANYDNYKELAMHAKRSFALGGGIKRATDIAFQVFLLLIPLCFHFHLILSYFFIDDGDGIRRRAWLGRL